MKEMTYETNRKMITCELTTVDSCSIDQFIQQLKHIKTEYEMLGYEKIRVDIDRFEERYSDWVGAVCNIKGNRFETVEEYEARFEQENHWKIKRREILERELESIKAELGEE